MSLRRNFMMFVVATAVVGLTLVQQPHSTASASAATPRPADVAKLPMPPDRATHYPPGVTPQVETGPDGFQTTVVVVPKDIPEHDSLVRELTSSRPTGTPVTRATDSSASTAVATSFPWPYTYNVPCGCDWGQSATVVWETFSVGWGEDTWMYFTLGGGGTTVHTQSWACSGPVGCTIISTGNSNHSFTWAPQAYQIESVVPAQVDFYWCS